jgi:hypothetical protein
MDRDFSIVRFKVNVSGSWANLVDCKSNDYEAVKAACETLARAHRGAIRFKALDAAGGVIEQFAPIPPGGHVEWHEPKSR